jgi:hypothetical protein
MKAAEARVRCTEAELQRASPLGGETFQNKRHGDEGKLAVGELVGLNDLLSATHMVAVVEEINVRECAEADQRTTVAKRAVKYLRRKQVAPLPIAPISHIPS